MPKVIERCILMTTDPGDLVLDPTCGSGTTAYVAEQWGRRWITIDTSRVALALARARIMGARYPYYLLADSPRGAAQRRRGHPHAAEETPTHGDIRQGFVYERVPHITLKSIANNAEIDVIWEKWQETLEPLRAELNAALGRTWEEWEIPREADAKWPAQTRRSCTANGGRRGSRGRRRSTPRSPPRPSSSTSTTSPIPTIHASASPDRSRSRACRRTASLAVDQDDEPDRIEVAEATRRRLDEPDFAQMILENLKTAGVQQAHKEDRIAFTALTPLAGQAASAPRALSWKASSERRAGIFIGPEFGTVSRPDLVAAAREAGDAGFDVLIACAFNYDAHSAEFDKLGRVPVLKARMNPDLHMADDLKNTGAGNLFVVFGEPDIEIETGRRRPDPGQDQGRRRVQAADRRGRSAAGPTRIALLVHRHRLQRGKLLRPPRLFPRRERPLQGAEDDAQGRDRRGGLGEPPQRHLAPVPQARPPAASRSRSSTTSATR